MPGTDHRMTITEYRWNYHKTYARNGKWSRSYQNRIQLSIVNYAELTDNANSRVGTPGKKLVHQVYTMYTGLLERKKV